MRDGRGRVALRLPDPAQEPVRAVGAAVLGEHVERGLEVFRGLRAAIFPEQGLPEGHAGREAAGVARDGGLERGDVGHGHEPHRPDHPLGLLPSHRGQRGRKAVLQEVLEVVVEVLQTGPQRGLERLCVVRAVAVRQQHVNDGGEPVPLLDQLEDQRCLVVALDHLSGVARARKPPIQLAHRPHLARRQRPDEANAGLMPPTGGRLALLVHGQPLREPSRHLAVGHADVERVRDLVPEGGGPVEVAPAPRGR